MTPRSLSRVFQRMLSIPDGFAHECAKVLCSTALAADLRNERSLPSVLIVHPDVSIATELGDAFAPANGRGYGGAWRDVIVKTTFATARAALRAQPPALLVTPIALQEFNGLHLVYLANTLSVDTRSVVHTPAPDPGHARDVRAAGAFYEVQSRLRAALPAYLGAALPPQDRRMNLRYDRRQNPRARGGRRAVDRYAVV